MFTLLIILLIIFLFGGVSPVNRWGGWGYSPVGIILILILLRLLGFI